MTRGLRTGLLALAVVMCAAACGSSSGVKATTNSRAETTAAAPQVSTAGTAAAGTTGRETTIATTQTSTGAPSLTSLVDAALSDHPCPTNESMSSAVGVPVAFDDSDVSAKGFCPYKSADENITVSVTFTPMDMTAYPDPNQTEVQGLGQKALWSEGSDELVVWFGNGSIIVSVLAFGQGAGFDAKTVATNIAKLVGST